MAQVEILAPGVSSTVQDRGRPGFAHLGVPHSGWVDPRLAHLVNRLVGNAESDAAIETAGALQIRAVGDLVVADSHSGAVHTLAAGEILTIPPAARRTWNYLAVRGGLQIEHVLGSAATDTLSGLGPRALAAGDRLDVGHKPVAPIAVDVAPIPDPTGIGSIVLGPRDDWFEGSALDDLVDTHWRIDAVSRVGVRLTSDARTALQRRPWALTAELASEAMVRGAIQVPPDGCPIMLLADHPTTGGYPVIAVVDDDDVAAIAQVPVGGIVRFRR